MLKRRIIPVQLLLNNRLVKTVAFGDWRDVGDPVKSSLVYSDQDADELVLLNIAREARSVDDLVGWVEKIAEVCFVPFTVGGGIRSVDDAARLIRAGADKVAINTAAYRDPGLLAEVARRYGRQAVVLSVDVLREGEDWVLRSDCGRQPETRALLDWLQEAVAQGAGEILLNSIDRDGRMNGYDVALLDKVAHAVDVPVIACGGAGSFVHLREGFEAGVEAVACGSLFNFGDNNPLRAKAFLKNYGIPLKRI